MNDFYYLIGIKCLDKGKYFNKIDLITIDSESYFVNISFEYYWDTENFRSIYNNLIDQNYNIINHKLLEFYLQKFSCYKPRTNYIIHKKYYDSYLKKVI